MVQPRSRRALAIEQTREVVSRVVEELMRKCLFTKDEYQRLLSNYPELKWLKREPSALFEKVRREVPNVELLRISPTASSHHRLFAFPRKYWVIYRDELQCREAVAEFLYANLDSDVFKLAPNVALSVVRRVLKTTGVVEEVIRPVQARPSNALSAKKKLGQTMS
mgnify:CR=1 FL=1